MNDKIKNVSRKKKDNKTTESDLDQKTYEPPQLIELGNLVELTKGSGWLISDSPAGS